MPDKRKLLSIYVMVVLAAFIMIFNCSCTSPLTMTNNPGDTSSWSDYPDISDLPDADPSTTATMDWDDFINNATNPTSTPPAVTQPPTVTPTTTPIPAPITTTPATMTGFPTISPFHGVVTGNWSAKNKYQAGSYSGTFSIVIDMYGGVQGTFSGDNSGDVMGNVDLSGNLVGKGTASGGTTKSTTNWDGKLIISGSLLSLEGTLEGPYITGTFSGNGTKSD
jgi:hypothetical protein